MDKLYHFVCGLGISLLVGVIAYKIGLNQPEAYGFVVAIIAGAAKETFDAIKAKEWSVHTWDVFDFLATCVGGFAGVLVLIVGFNIN